MLDSSSSRTREDGSHEDESPEMRRRTTRRRFTSHTHHGLHLDGNIFLYVSLI